MKTRKSWTETEIKHLPQAWADYQAGTITQDALRKLFGGRSISAIQMKHIYCLKTNKGITLTMSPKVTSIKLGREMKIIEDDHIVTWREVVA